MNRDEMDQSRADCPGCTCQDGPSGVAAEVEHTPIPWIHYLSGTKRRGQHRIIACRDFDIARVFAYGAPAEAEARAIRICLAVNSHADLVADRDALMTGLGQAKVDMESMQHFIETTDPSTLIQRLDQALAASLQCIYDLETIFAQAERGEG